MWPPRRRCSTRGHLSVRIRVTVYRVAIKWPFFVHVATFSCYGCD
nr:MAG TPA: hypothetical protein [Caudoviricetes sp.]